jgi:CheY-like chemotaxis protein
VPSDSDVSDVVREVVASLEPIAKSGRVRVEIMVPDAPLPVATSRPQLYTAVSNLVRNAIEASPKGGVVAVEARALRERVRIEVADQGPGIAEAQRARIFEPYFTTKPEGTGLGLPLVRHVVESSNGRLRVRSQRGRGARFTIELPAGAHVDDAVAERPQKSRKRSGVRVRSTQLAGRVLVVEDDPSMRDLIATTLEMHGATVVTASNATEALSAPGPFTLALIDLNLDVRGDRILAELRRSGQVGAGALVTGASPPKDLDPDSRPDRILRKPFDLEDLIETASELRQQAARANG